MFASLCAVLMCGWQCGPRDVPLIGSLPPPPLVVPRRPIVLTAAEETKARLESLSAVDIRTTLQSWLDTDDEGSVPAQSPSAPTEPASDDSAGPELVLALHRVHDPQNLGAILRSALFFGVSHVVLSEPKSGTLYVCIAVI